MENYIYMLSRVDERNGFMTPQQPIRLGANTDKVLVLCMIIYQFRLLNSVLIKVQSFLNIRYFKRKHICVK